MKEPLSSFGKMSPTQYLEERVGGQLAYFEQHSATNKRYYYLLQTLVVLGGAAIPVFISFSQQFPIFKDIASISGAMVVVITGILTIRKQQENWFRYRSVCENIQREKYAYLTRAGEYAVSASQSEERVFDLFVTRIELILANEKIAWEQTRKTEPPSTNNNN